MRNTAHSPMDIASTLFDRTFKARIPLMGTFELTRRCNLRCRHCYIDFSRPAAGRPLELSTARIKDVLRQLADAGTLHLTFTGGEIFLRGDILELCAFARKLSFDLRLFTNGTLLDKNMLRELAMLSVSGLEMSLYGREKTHDFTTRRKGSFRKTVRTVREARRRGIAVTLKSPVMKHNFKDYPWLLSFARELSLRMKFDPTIAPRDDGGKDNLIYRMTARQMKKLYADGNVYTPAPPAAGSDPVCSAGRNLLAIASDGTLYPCLQLLVPAGRMNDRPFSALWKAMPGVLARRRAKERPGASRCHTCDLIPVCQRCPGIALLEDHTLTGPSAVACAAARAISEIVQI